MKKPPRPTEAESSEFFSRLLQQRGFSYFQINEIGEQMTSQDGWTLDATVRIPFNIDIPDLVSLRKEWEERKVKA